MLNRSMRLVLLYSIACGACSGPALDDEQPTSPATELLVEDSLTTPRPQQARTPRTRAKDVAEALCPKHEPSTPESGSPLWLQSFDGLKISGVASDSLGNVLLARSGGETLKLSGAGVRLWSKSFGERVAVDAEDNVYVAGSFTDALALGASTLTAPNGRAAFVVKLDSEGNVAFAVALEGGADSAVASLAVNSAGEAAVSGPALGTLKLDRAGRVLWQKAFFGAIAFDAKDDLLLTGSLVGTQDFGSGALTSQGGSDVVLSKLGPDGAPVFVKSFGDAGSLQQGEAIAVDDDGNVFITGTFDGNVDFGAGALALKPDACSTDAWCVTAGFAAKLDAQGNGLWSHTLGPMRSVAGVAVDSNGNVLVSGALPGGVRPFRRTWLAKLASDGAMLWQRSEWPDTGIGAGHAVAVDTRDAVIWSLSARPSLELEEQAYLVKLAP